MVKTGCGAVLDRSSSKILKRQYKEENGKAKAKHERTMFRETKMRGEM